MQNQKHCKEASKLERREFRSLWDTEVYILISLASLPIKQGSRESQRKRSSEVLLLGGSST